MNQSPTVEVFYAAKANLGEGPFFEPETNQLLWVDIDEHTINFLNVDTVQNRCIISMYVMSISSTPTAITGWSDY